MSITTGQNEASHAALSTYALHIREMRWFIISSVALVLLSGGGIYLFSAFSAELAQQLNLSNTQLNSIGSSLNWGGWVGIVGGIVCDRRGAIFAGYISSALAAAGMILSALIVAVYGGVSSSDTSGSGVPTVLLCISMFTFSQGQCWAYLGSMKMLLGCIHGQDRGTVVGLLAAYFGLSAGVLSTFYKAFFVQVAHMGLAGSFIGFTILTAGLQFGCFHRMASTDASMRSLVADASSVSAAIKLDANLLRLSKNEIWLVEQLQKHAASLAILLLITNIYNAFYHDPTVFFLAATVMVAMVVLLAVLPTIIVSMGLVHGGDDDRVHIDIEHQRNTTIVDATNYDTIEMSSSEAKGVGSPPTVVTATDEITPNRPHSANGDSTDLVAFLQTVWSDILLVLSKQNFWLLAGTIGLGLGLPVTLLNNLATVVYSLVPQSYLLGRLANTPLPHDDVARFNSSSELGDVPVVVATLLAMFSVASTMGRLLGSALMGLHNEEVASNETANGRPSPTTASDGDGGILVKLREAKARLHMKSVHLVKKLAPLRWSFMFCAVALALLSNLICILVGFQQASTSSHSPTYLFLAVPLSGAGLGMIFAVGPVAGADLFGPQNFGRVWGLVTMMPCFTTEILSTMIAGLLADSVMNGEADVSVTNVTSATAASNSTTYAHPYYYVAGRKFCYGPECYNRTFLMAVLTGVLALVMIHVLSKRIIAFPEKLGKL